MSVSDEAHIEGEPVGKISEIVPVIEVALPGGAPLVDSRAAQEASDVPIIAVPLGLSLINAQKNVDTGGGAVVAGNVEADKFIGRDSTSTQNDLRYNSAGSSVTFLSPDNAALWQANMKLLQDIADVAFRLDDIPARLGALERFLHTPSVVPPITVSVEPLPVTVPVLIPMISQQIWAMVIMAVTIVGILFFIIGQRF